MLPGLPATPASLTTTPVLSRKGVILNRIAPDRVTRQTKYRHCATRQFMRSNICAPYIRIHVSIFMNHVGCVGYKYHTHY